MLKIKQLLIILFNLFFFFSTTAQAAACCGGGFATPSLIVGDDKAQLTTSYSYSQIIDDVGSDQIWRARTANENSQTFKIEAAHIFQDRWQTGVSIPVVTRSLSTDSSSGLGDVAGTLGYEYLPDWDYNPWRPRGLGFLQITLPTGKSANEADTTYQLDSRGRGFLAIGAGTLLTKIIRKWDVFTEIDLHKSFPKNYSNSQSQGRLTPGNGGNFGFGAGYNLSSLRLGTAMTWTYEEAINVDGTINSTGTPQQLTTMNLSASYIFENEWTTTLSYSDQTLFGSPLNTSLGRGISLLLQKRWLR